jgi:hypothetical protein
MTRACRREQDPSAWRTPVEKCANCVGKSFDNLHNFRAEGDYCRLLTGYVINLHRGRDGVEDMIRADIQGMRDLGAQKYAFDLCVVLECYRAEFQKLGMRQTD